jgi:hypothetical protein
MNNYVMAMKKALLRLTMMIMFGLFAGSVPGVVMVSSAANAAAEAPQAAQAAAGAAQPAQEASAQDDGTTFLFAFLGGILLLILFVVVVVVAVSASTPGVIDM